MLSKELAMLADFIGLLFWLVFMPANIQAGSSIPKNMIGEWKALNSDCEDGGLLIISETSLISGSSAFLMKHSYIISDSVSQSGSISLKLFDYKISNDGISFSKISESDDSVRVDVFLDKDILVLLFWKGDYRPYEYQIPVAYIRKEKSATEVYRPTIRSIFYLPVGYAGYALVALDQHHGEPAEYDGEGRRILHMPESGLLLTHSEPMPLAMAKREFAFYFNDSDGKISVSLPLLPNSCITLFKNQNFTNEQIQEYGYDPDQIYVYYYRYNPGRENINKLFGQEIKGQVFWFRVDTLWNLLKFGEMIPGRIERD
ncbi:MAG: hypothetical protein K0B37_08715 [Bacteroidales bacterium]|nr:hypothetical protein [Bacteroidales bacterium]